MDPNSLLTQVLYKSLWCCNPDTHSSIQTLPSISPTSDTPPPIPELVFLVRQTLLSCLLFSPTFNQYPNPLFCQRDRHSLECSTAWNYMEPYHAPFSTKQTIQIDKNPHMYKIQGERVKNLAGEENKMKSLCEGLDTVREMLVGKRTKGSRTQGRGSEGREH